MALVSIPEEVTALHVILPAWTLSELPIAAFMASLIASASAELTRLGPAADAVPVPLLPSH